MIENNKLIAEFMGWKDVRHSTISPDVSTNYSNEYNRFDSPDGKISLSYHWDDFGTELKYHTSWDWLMPVVEKIESLPINQFKEKLGFGNIGGDIAGHIWFRRLDTQTDIFFNIYYWQFDAQIQDLRDSYDGETPIHSLYAAVLQFIQWYNTQKQSV